MALWLFRRRTRRKHSIRAANAQAADDAQFPRRQTAPAAAPTQLPQHQQQRLTPPASEDVLSPLPASSLGQSSTDPVQRRPSRLRRLTRTYSFESGRKDEILVGRRKSARKIKREPAPPPSRPSGSNPATSPPGPIPQSIADQAEKKEVGAPLRDAAGHAVFDRVPTLYATKRDGGHLMSRKLSKRRKNSHDREREAELKALRDFTPVRPATDAWNSGRPLKKDSRRVKTGFSFVKNPWEREKHPSDVSLPLAESIHSSLSSDSEQVSYKVSALDVLAPKPTLKRANNPRWTPPQSVQEAAPPPARSDSQKKKISGKSQIPEATLRAHKRVDDLADDLDASDLRELMERDKRRRERKREREQQRIEARLARRAEAEKRAVENGVEAPQNLERGVLGRESVGLGVDTTSAVVTSSRHRSSADSSPTDRARRSAEGRKAHSPPIDDADAQELTRPLDVFHRVDSVIAPEPTTPAEEIGESIMPLAHEQSPKMKGFLRSKKSRSKSPRSENAQSDASGTPRNASETSSRGPRGPMSWTSIFKWGLRPKRSSGPSSFSNTSRDSMSTQPPAQPAAPFNVTFIPPAAGGKASTMPKRTRSRFREDLPELPLSPPDSRMQSPEYEPMPPVIMEQDSPPVGTTPAPTAPINIPGRRHDTPVSDDLGLGHRSSSLFRDGAEPSPEPHQSMSLASIDSEGSWLSGRLKGSRLSAQTKQRQAQMFDGPGDAADTGEHADDSAGIADDEYLHRVASRTSGAGYSAAFSGHESTGDLRPSSDEEDDPRWGAVSGKQPQVVRPSAAGRIKSREGLLNMVEPVRSTNDESEPGSPASPISNESEDIGGLQRATSINLGNGHARHISAGSARLLELSPRSSTDVKRRSWSADKRLSEPGFSE